MEMILMQGRPSPGSVSAMTYITDYGRAAEEVYSNLLSPVRKAAIQFYLPLSEFQPMWDDVKGKLGGMKIGLFGSYGWGSGEWMDSWAEDAKASGASLVSDPVIANNEPDADAASSCEALGAALV